MIVLNGSTESLELTTSSTASLSYYVDWTDFISGNGTPGRSDGTITTATTTTIVAAPSGATQRVIHYLSVSATTTTDNTVTLQRDVSATNHVMVSALVLSTTQFNTGAGSLLYSSAEGFTTYTGSQTRRGPQGRLIAVTTYTANATHTFKQETRSIVVEVISGGSGGCGCITTTVGNSSAGGGGPGGGFIKGYLLDITAGTATVVVGGGGTAGAGVVQSALPGAGGTSSFTVGGSALTVTGGAITARVGLNNIVAADMESSTSSGGIPSSGGAFVVSDLGRGGHGEPAVRPQAGLVVAGASGGPRGSGMPRAPRTVAGASAGTVPPAAERGVGGSGATCMGANVGPGGSIGIGGVVTVWEYN